MAVWTVRTSPGAYARLAGALYLYIVVAGSFGHAVRSSIASGTDAAATAARLAADAGRLRLAFTGEFLHLAADVGVAVLLYALLRPVHRDLALAAALFRVVSDVVLAVTGVTQLAALRLLEGKGLEALAAPQREALAHLALKVHADGYAVCLFFFSFCCLALGALVYRAGFLPRAFGPLLALAGASYLVNGLTYLLAPAAARGLFPAIMVAPFVAEAGLALWLLVRGVDRRRFEAALSAAAAR